MNRQAGLASLARIPYTLKIPADRWRISRIGRFSASRVSGRFLKELFVCVYGCTR